ncbi:DUF1294 domain-containing protein [Acuticoccus sp. M5D2P5]|uniref:DUF1294 domain-containing protein n=1 Tax=Acuticoccus kalidii TaxID=2910977 RepID=UPI001F1E27C3|nr:DUF1294 domain-containing protein [Acuticoccus kalidii]MCF3934511.1 DUF1294 domain-containing protein [Acuticoccus kalidii]
MSPFLLLAVWLVLINIVAFAIFARDKRSAIRDRRRVPERALLTLAAIGGAPAMVAGSAMIRHKTRKQPFRAILLTILALQIVLAVAAIAWSVGLI